MFSKLTKLLSSTPPEFNLSGWPEQRGYDMAVPKDAGEEESLPLVLAFHGYTQDSKKMRSLTSPDGDPEHRLSLDSLADTERFLVAYPNGTPIKLAPGRSWNGGGGVNGFAPVSDPARQLAVDDGQYCRDLLQDIQRRWRVDADRIYLLGISNGGAFVQRLAMEMPELWAAVATIAGCNQHAASLSLTPQQPMPLLHIHGTDDPVWPFEGGPFLSFGQMVSVENSLRIWQRANESSKSSEEVLSLPDGDDRTTISLIRYRGESPRQEIDFYRIEGGGHAWPGGQQFMPKALIGHVTHRLSTNQVVWDFFQRHSLGS